MKRLLFLLLLSVNTFALVAQDVSAYDYKPTYGDVKAVLWEFQDYHPEALPLMFRWTTLLDSEEDLSIYGREISVSHDGSEIIGLGENAMYLEVRINGCGVDATVAFKSEASYALFRSQARDSDMNWHYNGLNEQGWYTVYHTDCE